MDGHSSHYRPDTLSLASESGIIIFTLLPNTTHLLQPLDKGVFGPFKAHWKRVCEDFKVSHRQVINEYNFCSLFSKAWLESMTISNIAGGFRTTGLYPLNRDAIQLPGESNYANKLITPKLTFTPGKLHPQDSVLTSKDFKTAEAQCYINPRPSCIKNERIKGPDAATSVQFKPIPPPNAFGVQRGHKGGSTCKCVLLYLHVHVRKSGIHMYI